MTPLRPLRFRETKRKLEAAGFVETSQRGSHVKFVKSTPNGTRIVIVPSHRRDVPMGTLRSILRQSGLTAEEFDAL